MNSALLVDGYKTSHPFQYPKGTELVVSNYTARKSRLEGIDEIVFFGLQYYLKEYLIEHWNKTFFHRPKKEVREEYMQYMNSYCPLPSYDHIEALHDLGYLPIEIRAVAEGTKVPIRVPCMTIHNTHPDFFWLTNTLETSLSNILWMGINSATIADKYRQVFEKYAEETCDDDSLVPFQGHDFSYRGMAGLEAARISGAAHLTSFVGTDTVPAVVMLKQYYKGDLNNLIGCSVPACFPDGAEVLTDKGFLRFEDLSYGDRIAQYNENGSVSFVYPDKIHEYDYVGDLVTIKAGQQDQINFTVTPNHRVPLVSNNKYFCIKEASEVSASSKFKISGKVENGQNLTDFERLLIAFQADGSYSTRDQQYTGFKKGTIPMRFPTLKKKRKQKRLEELLHRLDFEYTKSEYNNGASYRIAVPVTNMLSKTFSWVDLTKVSTKWCQDFINELQYWDGSLAREGIITYSSVVKENTDIIQAIASLGEIRTHYNCYKDPRVNRQPLHCLTITVDRTEYCSSPSNFSKTYSHYSGKVRCVTVPSGMFIARQNDRVIVTGNSEHSVQCANSVSDDGKVDERVYVRQMLDTYPTGIFSMVSDGFDFWKLVTETLMEFKDEIEARDGKVVVRPDSGCPVKTICGDKDASTQHERDGLIVTLDKLFGSTVNSKGYKEINPKIGAIYGDAITMERQEQILSQLEQKGYASSNIVLGIGSFTYQYNTRDTHGGAVKATYVEINGKPKNIFKDPKTGDGVKKSLKGLIKVNPDFTVEEEVSWEQFDQSMLQPVFKDGILLVDQSIYEIRERVKNQ